MVGYGHKDIVEMLLARGAKIDEQTNTGYTALMIAAGRGDKEVVARFIAEKANLNLRNTNGENALSKAVSSNSKDIVEMLIANGVEIVEDEKGRTPFVMATLNGSLEIVKILENALSPEELLRQKQILKLLAVSHSTHLKGISQLESIGKIYSPISVNLEGAQTSYWLKRMSNATKMISQHYPDLLSPNETKELLQLLDTGMNASNQIVLDRIKEGLPVLLNTGFKEHRVEILIWGNYFILCNRGGATRKNIEVFRFDPEAFNESVLNEINQVQKKDIEAYKKLFFGDLPSILSFRQPQEQFEKDIEEVCNLIPQIVGNCSWASPEAAVWAFFVLGELLTDGSAHLGITEEQKVKFKESKKFHTWLAFNQLYNLERYLGVRHVRSTDDPEKVEKSAKGRKVNVIDDFLVFNATTSIKEMLGRDIQDEAIRAKVRSDIGEILSKYAK